jgi:hypothetical protein
MACEIFWPGRPHSPPSINCGWCPRAPVGCSSGYASGSYAGLSEETSRKWYSPFVGARAKTTTCLGLKRSAVIVPASKIAATSPYIEWKSCLSFHTLAAGLRPEEAIILVISLTTSDTAYVRTKKTHGMKRILAIVLHGSKAPNFPAQAFMQRCCCHNATHSHPQPPIHIPRNSSNQLIPKPPTTNLPQPRPAPPHHSDVFFHHYLQQHFPDDRGQGRFWPR